ncbi:hypothetical protein [Altererythrobacter aquiaggeris]|uniref:hypothetical protein n=1 Tax=Aestuarierythrobacter aquiaggeris TaxID=1898396 RepID=UPI00301AE26B
MELDGLLLRYFATANPSDLKPDALAAGIERCQVDLGLETDPGKRFALWSLLYMLGAAPELTSVFEDEAERNAARSFMDLMAAAEGQ